jgi:putative aminopeptidase FrvX
LQTEVYNYSGTDARAFPHQGLPAPVYALLLPTRGNHTPTETAHVADLHAWLDLLHALLAPGAGHGLWDVGFAP